MKRLSLIGLLLAFVFFNLIECKKDDVQPQNPPADTTDTGNNGSSYNKSDTTVSLKNGRITIAIPAGAMKEGTKVNIGSSNVAFVDTTHQLYQFELKPAGTTFKKPVTLTVHYDSTWLKGHSPWDIGIAYKDDKTGEWYAAINGSVDTAKHTISIKTKHFSHWSIFTCFHLYMQYGSQLSEDNSHEITMELGSSAYLLVNMVAPPAWKSDPDKSKHFSDPLVATLIPHKITPREDYQKAIKPDLWMVEHVTNGNTKVGTISFVGGKSGKLYQYTAPKEAPSDNQVGIIAQINFARSHQGHRILWLLQGVRFKGGAWKLTVTDTTKNIGFDGMKVFFTASDTAFFHLDKNANIIFDGENHGKTTFYKTLLPSPLTLSINTSAYFQINSFEASYNKKNNFFNINLSDAVKGNSTYTACDPEGCITNTYQGFGYGGVFKELQVAIKKHSGYTATWDTSMMKKNIGKVSYHYTYNLESIKKSKK